MKLAFIKFESWHLLDEDAAVKISDGMARGEFRLSGRTFCGIAAPVLPDGPAYRGFAREGEEPEPMCPRCLAWEPKGSRLARRS
jgi:hypothetical protein